MFTLAPSLFFAILFGWAPWPYHDTHPGHRRDGDDSGRTQPQP